MRALKRGEAMAKYAYTAQTAGGEAIQSMADAASLPDLAARLAASGQAIISARELGAQLPDIRGVPYYEVTAFYRQTGSSLDAGLPLAETLEMLAGESRNHKLTWLLHHLKTLVSEGIPLSQAMSKFPGVFPEVHVAIVRSGEESGRLETALMELADQAEALSNMNRRIASALVYPAVIGLFAVMLFSGAFMSFVPKFRALFSDLGIVEYPGLTQVVFFVCDKAPLALLFGLIGLGVLIGLMSVQRRAASGRMWLDTWKLRVPALGQIIEKAALARFSGALGLLLDSGVDLPQATRLAADGAGNRLVGQAFKAVAGDVELGHSLSESVDRCSAMPPSMAWRVGVAESTGALPEALTRMSRMYMAQVDSLVTATAGFIEPLLIIIIGSGIGMLILSMFLPLVGIVQSLSGGA